MKQSCTVNMIRRQVKQRMARVKLERERERERKRDRERAEKVFYHCSPQTTELIRKYLNSIQIFGKIFRLKCYVIIFRYDIFYDWFTPSQILIFSNLILHNFILVSKSNFSSSDFDAPGWKCANEFASMSDT